MTELFWQVASFPSTVGCISFKKRPPKHALNIDTNFIIKNKTLSREITIQTQREVLTLNMLRKTSVKNVILVLSIA